jgi:hypothetical protein
MNPAASAAAAVAAAAAAAAAASMDGSEGSGVQIRLPRGAGVGMGWHRTGGRGGVPYHNVIHACDVMQSTYAYLYLGDVAAALDPKQQLALLLAAVVHDVGHPGLNNDFFNKTNAAVAHRCSPTSWTPRSTPDILGDPRI